MENPIKTIWLLLTLQALFWELTRTIVGKIVGAATLTRVANSMRPVGRGRRQW